MVVKITGLGRAGLFQKITLGFFPHKNIFLFIEIYYYYLLPTQWWVPIFMPK